MSPKAVTDAEAVVDTQTAELVSPDTKGSLSEILDRAKDTQVLSGHPADTAVGPESTETETVVEDGTKAAADTKVNDKVETKVEDKPQFKHSSWEKTESARVEAEREMHAAKEEAADLKRKLADKEAADKAADDAIKAEATQRKPEEIRAEAKAKVKETLNKIRALDEDDPEYDEKVADAWADAGLGAPTTAAAPDKEEIAKLVSEQVKNTLQADREATAESEREADEARTRERAQGLATKSGLEMKQGSVDFRLFWDVAKDIPENIMTQPLEDQVEWTVDEVRRLKGEVVKTKEQKAADAKRLQLQNSVLEKGPEKVVPTVTKEPYSINTIVNKQQNARRI